MSSNSQSQSLFSLPNWLTSYRSEWLRPDIIAGLTAAAVVIPKSMAYATIAGLPVQVGLYTAFLPMIIYAVLGTSRVLSVSTTTTIAILTAAEFAEVVPNGDAASLLRASATLTLLVGAMLVVACFLRLGFVANFISQPVLTGFKAGIGIVIVLDQVPKLLGVHIPRATFLKNVLATLRSIPETKLLTLGVSVTVIVLLVALEHFMPKSPAPLIGVAVGIAGAYFLHLSTHGVELVGRIPQGLPPVTLPALGMVEHLWPGALGIALMSFTETIAAGRAFAKSDEPWPQANRELMATGLANVGGALLGAMPGGGGTTQTAVNRLAGARTQVAELVTGAMTLVTMLLLAPMIALMPQATLAAVVIVYSVGLIKPAEFREILRVRRTEFLWAVIAMAGVVLVGTLKGILVAIIASLVALAYQVANPSVYVLGRKPGTNIFRPRSAEHPEDETYPGLLMVRPEGRIFFANAENLSHKVWVLIDEAKPNVVIVDMRAVFDLEYTALKMFTEGEKKQREYGMRLWLVGMNPHVFDMVQKSALGESLGREGMHLNLESAVAKYAEHASLPATV
ncbi:sulfate transporter [Candidatus Koribacter versatilis Ellin345]|uniref:Sulfate transporter n=1 Tax=Koribacter versatilis (strain Ellin345) TaxID=204669 RepID=Q1IHB3_KORVE|nr:SulP family inorganic anion transporter [Candidatus Koribacter versatilis]ABF43737.1 sulfate transporter [Candidatus Koribacter versatilis Ellin345]